MLWPYGKPIYHLISKQAVLQINNLIRIKINSSVIQNIMHLNHSKHVENLKYLFCTNK